MTKTSNLFSYPKYRTFGGKRYHFQGSADTKRGATAIKKLLQDDSLSVRIVPRRSTGIYLLYGRKGK